MRKAVIDPMKLSRVAALCATLALTAACNKNAPTPPNFAGAIDTYYQAHPACLWSSEKKFPIQAATSDDAKTQGYDALVDQGLLTRTTSEKKIIIISRQENNYDLSANGRSAWTADPSQPGYGNFCFGHPQVTSIDSFNPNEGGAVQYSVNYHYGVSLPDWANTPEMKTAFPSVTAQANGAPASATLIKNGDAWQVQNATSVSASSSTGQ